MKGYVPTTADEWQSISAKYQGDDDSEYPWEAYIEQAVLERIEAQGLVIVPRDMLAKCVDLAKAGAITIIRMEEESK